MKEKTKGTPTLQSMPEYIKNHFMDEMMQEIEYAIHSGFLKRELDLELKQEDDCQDIVIKRNDCDIVYTDLWRENRDHLLADMRFRLRLAILNGNASPRNYVRYVNCSAWFVFDDEDIHYIKGIDNLSTHLPPERDKIRLSKYLIPVMTSHEMEVEIRKTIRQCLGAKAFETFQPDSATYLANAMGLKIMSVPLYRGQDTSAILFLKEGMTRIQPLEPDSDYYSDRYEDISVPRRTILLNQDRQCQNGELRDIYHECFHYEWHYMFYTLQEMHCADLNLFNYDEAEEASKPYLQDLSWVERQANYAGVAAIFPQSVFKEIVHGPWQEVRLKKLNLGEKLAHVITVIADKNQIPKSIIKTRMIQMGCIGAKGAFNYVDGEYIDHYAFDESGFKPGQVFHLRRAQFVNMYAKDEGLRNLINDHRYVYVDGHVCLNSPTVVRETDKGPRLTEWALAHVDSCCLRFEKVYYSNYLKGYKIGELHCDKKYNEAYLQVHSIDICNIPEKELIDKNIEYLESFPRRPSEAIQKLISDRIGSQNKAAVACDIPVAKINRMCHDDTYSCSIQDLTKIIVGLHIPPILSAVLLDIAGYSSTRMLQFYRHKCIIDCMFMDDLETVVRTNPQEFES